MPVELPPNIIYIQTVQICLGYCGWELFKNMLNKFR